MPYDDMELSDEVKMQIDEEIGEISDLIVYVIHLHGNVFRLVFDGNEAFDNNIIFDGFEDAGYDPRNDEWLSPAEYGEPVETEADYIQDWLVEITLPISDY